MLGVLPYPPEKRDLIAANLRPDFRAVFLFTDRSGCRIHEALNLAAGHIWDFDRGQYRDYAVLRVAKGGKQRRICLTPEIRAIYEERRIAYGGSFQLPEAAVFRQRQYERVADENIEKTAKRHGDAILKATTVKPHRGKRKTDRVPEMLRAPLGIVYSHYRPALKKAIIAAGLDPDAFSSHSARKAFAKRLFKAGLPLKSIADLMGHSSVKSTESYLETLEGDEAVKALMLAEEVERRTIAANGGMIQPPSPQVRSALEILGLVAKSEPEPAPVPEQPKAFDAGVESY